jgi:hypothetical protein
MYSAASKLRTELRQRGIPGRCSNCDLQQANSFHRTPEQHFNSRDSLFVSAFLAICTLLNGSSNQNHSTKDCAVYLFRLNNPFFRINTQVDCR